MRAELLNNTIEQNLMDVDEAKRIFEEMRGSGNHLEAELQMQFMKPNLMDMNLMKFMIERVNRYIM